MISSLHGNLIFKDLTTAVVECGGVGMKCMITETTSAGLPECGNEAFLFTHLSVREDALDLYGFSTEDELRAFKLLISVSGVGAKIALALLSRLSADTVMLSIASGDSKALTAAPGVGKKMAEKIIFELKEKVAASDDNPASAQLRAVGNATSNTSSKEAVEALVSLGYSQMEAARAVSRLEPSLSVEQMIKLALKELAGRL